MKTMFAGMAVAVLLLCSASVSTMAADSQYVIIGTGGVTGVYYPTGGSICRMVNRKRSEHGIRCAVESTKGSVYNVTKVRERDLDMAVVQSDVQYHAYHGSDEFKDAGADKKLRSVFSLHPEPFTVLARKDSDISTFADLKGKRINIGNVGSGQRATFDFLLKEMGWTHSNFLRVFELKSSEQSEALCQDRFDAMVFVVGHPSGSIKEATNICDSNLVSVSADVIDLMTKKYSYYREVTIPGNMYRGNEADVETFGVGATLVVSADAGDEMVYQVVKAVFENFDTFTQLHPAFHNLQRENMIRDRLTAPLHTGAERYYKEVGLLK